MSIRRARSVRRALALYAAFVLSAAVAPASAQTSIFAAKTLLGNSAALALDKLSQPDSFRNDPAIRIVVVGARTPAEAKAAGKGDTTNDLSGNLNDAAEQAATEARPILRAAIDHLTPRSFAVTPGATRAPATAQLKRAAGGEIVVKLTPIVRKALDGSGVFKQTVQLTASGYDAQGLSDFVARRTADAIFAYMAREEERLRVNPMSSTARTKGLRY